MLVLSRLLGVTLTIGDDIQLCILSARDGNVRIGIKAPPSVEVHREEVYRRIHDERTLAPADD